MIISAQHQALRMPSLACTHDAQIGSVPSETQSFQDVFQKTGDQIQKNLQARMATAAGILKGTRKESGAPEKTGSANTRKEPVQDKTAPPQEQDTAPLCSAAMDAAPSVNIPGEA